MEKDNAEMTQTENGEYRLVSGNAQTTEAWATLEEAQEMMTRHTECWRQAEDEAEYQDISPVSWE